MNQQNTTPKTETVSESPKYSREQLIEQLLDAVIELRKAWIAPHRFSEQKASLNVARLSDEIQQLEA